nr:hypothetical protein [Tanacetum cinerariifolium]
SLFWFVLRAYQLSMDRGFLSPKEKGSGRGVKEKEWRLCGEGKARYIDTSSSNVKNTGLKSKALNIRTLYTPTENGVDVVVPVESIKAVSESEDGLSVIVTKISTPLMLESYTFDMRFQSWGRSSNVGAMIELKTDAELRDTIVVFGHTQEECLNNPGLGVAKNMKKPSQAPKGFPVGSKLGFKPAKEYRPVSKKPTTNISGNKNHDVKHMKHVSNLNPFNILSCVENDVDLSANEGTSNLVSKESNSSGSSFWNVESSSMSATPIVEKIRNLETLIMDGKATLMDDEGVPVKKVDYLSDYDSKDEVALVDNDIARSMAVEKGGFGTTSLLEQ